MPLRIAVAFVAVALLSAAAGDMENDTNRPGPHYLRGTMPTSPSPERCRDACITDSGRCRSWTYVRPNVEEAAGVCYLRTTVPGTTANECCVSGVLARELTPVERRAAEARVTSQPLVTAVRTETIAAGMENDTDRPGSDVMHFTLPRGSGPESCRSACSPGGRCKAWTYVRPGVQGTDAVCYLKDKAPPARANACCISGLVEPLKAPRPEDAVRAPMSVPAPTPGTASPSVTPVPGARVPEPVEILQDEIEPGMEQNTDRPGRDIARFTTELPTYRTRMKGTPPGGGVIGAPANYYWSSGQSSCQSACWDDDRCAAWTYVRRGVQGRDAVCYLKGPGTSKVSNSCCISGLREPPQQPDPAVIRDRSVLKPTG